MWRKNLIRHQGLFRAVVVDVVVLVLILAGLIPMIRSGSTNLKKIAVRTKDQKALTEKVTLLSQIDQNVLAQRSKIIRDALPEKKDVIAYLASLDGLSRELGLSFGGITLSPGDVSEKSSGASESKKSRKTVASLQVLDTDVKIVGTQEGIYSFLRLVEQTLPLMQVADVKVSAGADGTYSLSLSIGMLWAPYQEGDVKGSVSLFDEKEEQYFQKLITYKRYDSQLGESDQGNQSLGKSDLFSPGE